MQSRNSGSSSFGSSPNNRDYETNRHPRDYGTGRDEENFYTNESDRGFSGRGYTGKNSDRGYRSQGSEMRGRHFGKGPKNYRRSDERIEEEVNDALWRHGDIDASEIEVKVDSGIVTLSGTVEDRETRRAAEMAIENLGGVEDVRNELRLKKNETSSISGYAASSKPDGRSKSSSKGATDMM